MTNQLQKDIKTILLKLEHSPIGLIGHEKQAYERLKRYSERDLSYDGGMLEINQPCCPNEELKDNIYNELDNILPILMELYETANLKDGKKLNTIYNRLKELMEEVR